MFRSFKFFEGQVISPDVFLRTLTDFGYRRQAEVSQEGECARRGGIVDVFPTTFEYPVRIEWDADTVRSIDSYSLTTGRPFWNHKIVILLPKKAQGRPFKINALSQEVPLNAFVDIHKGDYVVHPEHGVGIYLGMENVLVAGEQRPHLLITYQGEDRLFVPADQMHLVQKYVSFSNRKPRVHRMGSGEWKRTKLRAQKATVRVACDLLKIQALRKALGGHAFGPDTSWQSDFEKAFPYPETPDQARAVEDTKHDMEAPCAMDRLLCGDVGYGKTEVAMRAAFKCVMGQKQVAILVPTTILAEQHYQNFQKRLKDFPIRAEMLSRFRTPARQKQIIDDTANGKVDILIGTHRLISSDIRFADLGLVIIDEEQRFGVKHKEKLKEMRSLVDVLTLTATPIPRTLYMSLMGAKDISVINTPPENRMAIETHVVAYDRALLSQAIERELKRSGQVYFVHNRVEDIEEIEDDVVALAPPGARVVHAHGQMPAKVLEKIMVDFLNNRIDVLVSTTIIESGIDVPNANTIIINNADNFGLADLHQMRGRVGRFTKKAYAYFVVHPRKALSGDARKRLEAIHEYSQLGAGFKIAMEDLELRGAGNLLGLQQHGHITAVGFDLYCRLLRESVAALQQTLDK
ncbi:MAG: transcription-repair coupling factor [Candidatus Omnitrophica bacterium]|nr:transcription-repair coupling factor [Candidatus Omnitrophota bacterium]MDD5573947.1 transcription-repair coupling factor [Candidatus Omnitrophota bacterium]